MAVLRVFHWDGKVMIRSGTRLITVIRRVNEKVRPNGRFFYVRIFFVI